MSRSLVPALAVSAVLGAVVAIGAVELFDLGGGKTSTTTVVQQAPLTGAQEKSDGSSQGGGLTARDIYKRDAPGVVFIRAQVVEPASSPFDFGQQQQGEATGSGFVIAKDGTILTNAHVVENARKVRVQFADQRVETAKIVGRDRSTDLAVLKVDPDGLELHPLTLGSSMGVQVGDPTVAIGNPFGLERTLTTGVVSATKRTIPGLDNFQIDNVIQTDAAINPGNSGGPLIDAAGRVIGINSQIRTGGNGSNGNIGIGFAVPIDTAKRVVPQLQRTGKVERGYLGVETRTVDRSLADLNLPAKSGALVQTVTPGSPAAKAGIHEGDIVAQLDGQAVRIGGDIIVAVDGHKVRSSEELVTAVTAKKGGDTVKLDILRDGKKRSVEVQLADRPQQAVSQQTP
ncbi:MAG TPA: trypsin-like peptidase domain-containing protein [Solirubrobacteraceae bacterium]|jgi:S1-C subfamily serine protease|nr:trypsin-like peptidase domain-containing protein [Solirubrobacteraceae bacterium]